MVMDKKKSIYTSYIILILKIYNIVNYIIMVFLKI